MRKKRLKRIIKEKKMVNLKFVCDLFPTFVAWEHCILYRHQ